MPLFLLNMGAAAVFTILLGSSRISVFAGGFVLGYLVLWVTSPLYPDTRYFKKLPLTLTLAGYFLLELILSTLRVMWDILTPTHTHRPGIIGIPLSAATPMEIFLLTHMISLTPGTLSLDLSTDLKTLYVHVMFLDDPDAARATIKEGLERRILEVMRS